MTDDIRRKLSHVFLALSVASVVSAVFVPRAAAQLIGNPFVTGFQGWQSTYTAPTTPIGGLPNWSVLIAPEQLSGFQQQFLMESSGGAEAMGTHTGTVADGKYKPYILINSLDTSPTNYEIKYQLASVDNDGFGVVFGYQDNNNYFRVGLREQSPSNQGFQEGTSVQKVVNGTITQIANTLTGFVPPSTGVPFELKVIVTGSNWDIQVAPTLGGTFASVLSGSDADLQPGKYGVHSWQQREVSATTSPQYGTIVGPITTTGASFNKTTDFKTAIPLPWRQLIMFDANATTGFEIPAGTTGFVNANEDFGNFGQDFIHGTIFDDSNGSKDATAAAPNIDFIGPAVVVATPNAGTLTNYRYSVRVENRDNDGIGLLFRVSDSNEFYRINWNTEGPAVGAGTAATRPPLGMSIQKYAAGAWSEIYRDNQASPKFLPADSVPFDVSIQAINNQFKIDVLSDPNGPLPQSYSYGVITDASGSPVTAGSVGLTSWNNGDADNGAVYSAYNGNATSLVQAITAFTDFSLTVDRTSGNVKLVNNSAVPVDIKGVTLLSGSGTIDPALWTSIADAYDELPGNGSVDTDDPWTEITATVFKLEERENSGGNGGQLTAGEIVDLGNLWRKSKLEDLSLRFELANGDVYIGTATYINGLNGGMSYSRSDLNTDGSVNPADWNVFFPNMLTNMSAMTRWERAVKGDLDLDGDNDLTDFLLFKTDYEVANGAGSFGQLVPEPSTFGLFLVVVVGAGAIRLRRRGKLELLAISAMVIAGASSLTATEARAAVFAAQIDGVTKTVVQQTAGPTLFVGTQGTGGAGDTNGLGDLSLLLGAATVGTGGQPFTQATGMIHVSPNKLQHTVVQRRNLVETPGEQSATILSGFPSGMWLSLTEAGGSGAEVNYQVSMSSFKFADNWQAGHYRASNNTFFSGNNTGVTVTPQVNMPVSFFGPGHYKLSIAGVNSLTDGMLFAIGESNSTSGRTVPVGILPDGSGWDIRVQTESMDFQSDPATIVSNWGYVYIPYGNTKNLRAAGNIQLSGSTVAVSNPTGGPFSVSRVDLGVNGTVTPITAPDGVVDAGRALLKIPGKSDATGMLMIGVSSYASAGGGSGADDNIVAYEYNSSLGGWLLESYDLNGAGLQNSDTYFAYFDYANPIEIGTPTIYKLTAEVNRTDGTITLKNNSTDTIGFDYYQIDSAAGSLNLSGWNSLSDQNFEAIGGGIGQSFDEAGGSSNSSLAEAFLLTESGFPDLGIGNQVGLGMTYNNVKNAQDLVLTYHDSNGFTVTGLVTYIGTAPGIQGDFNDDGKVDAADYVLWRKNVGQPKGTLLHDPSPDNPIGLSQYNLWRSAFGNPPGSGSSLDGSNVPEPAIGTGLMCLGALAAIGRRRTKV